MHICTSLHTDNHTSTPPLILFTGQMPFLSPIQQRQCTEGNLQTYTLPPGGVKSTVMSRSVCLSVCSSVHLHNLNSTAKLYQIFCACCLWLWLSRALVVHYVFPFLWMTLYFHIPVVALLHVMCIPKWWQNTTTITAKIPMKFCSVIKYSYELHMGDRMGWSLIYDWLVVYELGYLPIP